MVEKSRNPFRKPELFGAQKRVRKAFSNGESALLLLIFTRSSSNTIIKSLLFFSFILFDTSRSHNSYEPALT
eukprot:scaffold6420_cov168-Amphora_coffeaeformis.AAC.31